MASRPDPAVASIGPTSLRIAGDSSLTRLLAHRVAPGEVAWTCAAAGEWGTAFVAATSLGACRLELTDAADPARAGLARLAAAAPRERLREDRSLRLLVDAVEAFLQHPQAVVLDLPLDLTGTPFQLAAWEALRAVRAGETTTYARLATRLGRPRAARAVGQAVGANPVAFAIPCHRVIASDGGLGGYAWGTSVKARLLAAERARHARTGS